MTSMRKCVNAKCKECIYDENGKGTWRQQVEACTATKCALWPIRPVSASLKIDPEDLPTLSSLHDGEAR
jgi:hypothetical protein